MNTGSRKDKLFTGIAIAMHLVFFLLAWHFKRIYNGDSSEYIYEALNIKKYFFFYSGNPGLPIVPEYMTQRPPLYPLFLSAFYLFIINNWVVLFAQNILSVFNIVYLRKTITRLGYNKKYDWLLLLFVLTYPAQFIYANTIVPDLLLQTFVLVYLNRFVMLVQTQKWKYAMGMSIALILGFLVKPVLYPFTVLHAVILMVIAIKQKVKTQRPLAIAIMPLCMVLLYSYWNLDRTGKFHFSSNTAFNALYYPYLFERDKYGMDSAEHFIQKERATAAELPEYSDRYEYARDRGMEILKANFVPYMLYHLKNSARIFIEPGKAEIDLFTGDLTLGRLYSKQQTGFYATMKKNGIAGLGEYIRNNRSLPVVMVVFLFNCIKLVCLGLFFFRTKGNGMVKLLVLVLLLYFAVAAGPIANTRYFLPVSLIVSGCAVANFKNKQFEDLKIND